MSRELYACLYLRQFPLQAQLRLRPELRSLPVVVFDGCAPSETVCSMNRAAQRKGVIEGMTRVEIETVAGVHSMARSPQEELLAGEVFLECAARFSPRIEQHSADTYCICILDIAGTERLFGSSMALAQRMRESLAKAGLRASVAVSGNFHTAMLKASQAQGISIIEQGSEADVLASLPLSSLRLEEKDAETFILWGIRSLGELAALPEIDLITRLGQKGRRFRELASGICAHAFQPVEPEVPLREFCEFETPIEQMDSLLFVAARMIDSLTARASERALALASMSIEMHAKARVYPLTIRPGTPSIDRKFLLKLVQIELATHPPAAAITALTVTAAAACFSKVQLGLFSPQLPESSRLDVTLARLRAIVGDDRVGSPVLEDSHRMDAFRVTSFSVHAHHSEETGHKPRIALRRLRPSRMVQVRCHEEKPVAFLDGNATYAVIAAYGPWRTSGCWWATDDWDSDEWDVLIARDQSQQAYVLLHDAKQKSWRLEAVYD